ncbi:restriction endonuclease subunit S [Acinetobacter sp. Gutcm_16]|uniref:restriction endonuclease subunit S n=1 Tax=Acinetobacter sp. Gutcm_16 TaxID=3026087 RepID=UPI0023626401|nr:restriction endonuclease subunit S [Acinetobacter sp. Gutcm_16]MDD0803811.1 restriction endonuclease subunit S [Acinetobacter sp. Gutcm_16]
MASTVAKYQKYAEYKDSGVEWFVELPIDWKVSKLKQVVDQNRQITYGIVQAGPNVENGIPYIRPADMTDEKGIKSFDELLRTSEQIALSYDRSKIKTGDIVISIGPSFGKVMMTPANLDGANLTQGTARIAISLEHNSRYFFWVLRSTISFSQWESVIGGATFRALNLGPLADTYVGFPSYDEQVKIATFLDHETTKIDHLIEKQQQLIELLKEKRQAVISHAVTKGLNPNVKMKDSGMEWLGEVPEHWTVTRAKFVSDIFVPQRNKPELNDMEGYSWVTMDDMKNKYIQSVNRYVTKNSAMLAGSKILKKRAVIASCVGNFGITSINNIDVIINQQLQAFIPRNIKAEYLQNLVSISKKYFELIGTAATLVYVNQEGFQNLPVLLPPYDEQVAICVQIENDENKYDQLIHLGLKQIKILQERRTALISSAVTGKIDLRNWQSPTVAEAQTEFSA